MHSIKTYDRSNLLEFLNRIFVNIFILLIMNKMCQILPIILNWLKIKEINVKEKLYSLFTILKCREEPS